MKAITLTQPWASLVAIGAKRIETRSWQTNYRGPLAIHAAKTLPKYAREFMYSHVAFMALVQTVPFTNVAVHKQLPYGQVIATCRLAGCFETDNLRPGVGIGVVYDSGLRITEEGICFWQLRAWALRMAPGRRATAE